MSSGRPTGPSVSGPNGTGSDPGGGTAAVASTSGGTGGVASPGSGGGGGGVQIGSGGSFGSGGIGSGSGGVGGSTVPAGFDAGTDPNRNAVTPPNLCDRFATIECAGEIFCCTNPGRDPATCKKEMLADCMTNGMADAIAAQPPAAFDATAAKAVFTQLETLSSQCDPSLGTFAVSAQGARSMFKGTLAAGANCQPANQLDKAMAGGALVACTGDAYACLPNVIPPWTCSKRANSGGHCFSDLNCTDGLFCDNPSLDIAGSTCMMRKGPGTTCAKANECQSLYCISGKCAASEKQAAYCYKQH